jgi:hypothetical protein
VQLSVAAKSPLATTEEMVSAVLPTLVSLTNCGLLTTPTDWLPKVRIDGESRTRSIPVPFRRTTCGLPDMLSLMANPPVLDPTVRGVKVILIEQLAFG